MAVDLKGNERLQKLIAEGKKVGYLTYDQINEGLSHEEFDAEQVDDILQVFADEGIRIVDHPADEPEVEDFDEEAEK